MLVLTSTLPQILRYFHSKVAASGLTCHFLCSAIKIYVLVVDIVVMKAREILVYLMKLRFHHWGDYSVATTLAF